MTDIKLTGGMRVEIVTTYTAEPAPVPGGQRIIYKIPGAEGSALCSDCMQDAERVEATLRYYSVRSSVPEMVPADRNDRWHCTAKDASGATVCREYGDRL